jgi:hypothetical protein
MRQRALVFHLRPQGRKGLLGLEPMNPEQLADFPFDMHSGLKSEAELSLSKCLPEYL